LDVLTFLAVCAVGIFLYSRLRRLTTTIEPLEKENASLLGQLHALTTRVCALETTLERLTMVAPAQSQTDATPAPLEATKAPPVVTTPAKSKPVLSTPQQAPFVSPAQVTATPLTAHGDTLPSHPPPADAAPRVVFTPNPIGHDRLGEKKNHARNLADLEERLGANWLNKIGTVAFVIGVALLLNYSMHYLGPAGKIALGYALSAVMLGIGVFGERTERYRIAVRAVLGGGWALAYFTTYALHNIAAVRLVTSAGLGFALLFTAAVAMVAHSLRYRSEITTGFAYLLAFVSVAVSTIPIGALIATALLAASLVVILRARRWFVVEPLAIVATYAVHWLWLNQVYERIGGHKPFPEFAASVTLLSIYWAIYLVSYFLRDARDQQEAWLLTASFLLNAAGYLALLHDQSLHPEWRFWFVLVAGAVYFGVSAWSRHIERRWGFVLASTLGAALMIAAIPYRYSGSRLEVLWLVEVEALLIAGWRLLDKHLRMLATAGAAILTIYVAIHDLAPRLDTWQPPDARSGWLLVALAAAFYTNRLLKDRPGADFSFVDEIALALAPVVATGFLLAASWVALPLFSTAVAWVLIAFALVEASRMRDDAMLRYCGHGAALFAVARLLLVNMTREDTWHNVSLRLLTVSASCALLYLASRRHLPEPEPATTAEPDHPNAYTLSRWMVRLGGISTAYTGAATLLVALLLWDEASSAAVGLAWGLFGLALLETAEALREKPLLVQGRLLLVASFVRIFIADLNSTSRVGPFAAPVITVTLLAAIYYYAAFSAQDAPRVRATLLWFGTLSLAALLRFELPVEWVAVSWAVMAVVLYALSHYLHTATFREQCYAMTLFSAVRCAFDNFYQLSPWHFTNLRTATIVACALLFYLLFAVVKLQKNQSGAMDSQESDEDSVRQMVRKAWQWIGAHEQHLFFFVPTILLTVLLSLEVRRGFLTATWGVEGLIVFIAVLKMDERAYRWFSLLLLLLCVGRVVTVDVWNLDALGRIVSFLGLGAALLVVSFLYARHRELLRRVL
jgi:uncharacterized membrane protein